MPGTDANRSVTIEPVAEADRPLLWRFVQYYMHDLSEFDSRGPGADGEFSYDYFDLYFPPMAPGRQAFFVRAGGALAGFALLRRLENGRMQMAEFFILRSHRRYGVGREAVAQLFALWPGPWDLTIHPNNLGAQRFWAGAIEEAGATDWDARGGIVVWHRFTLGATGLASAG